MRGREKGLGKRKTSGQGGGIERIERRAGRRMGEGESRRRRRRRSEGRGRERDRKRVKEGQRSRKGG